MNGPVHNPMISSQNYLQQAQLQSDSTVYMQKSEKEAIQQTYSSSASNLQNSVETLTTQKAVAFLAGPRERIYVLGNPIDYCLRCHQEGLGQTSWRPHRHIGELKIRYICERHFDDWESNHHIDIPLCPICSQVLYLYELNVMLGVSNARRLHKYVLKCASRHILPLLDLFCQTKKGGERCNANFKLQWCYGTMVKRCELQKNRDHDLWWVRYKNEWKQRRTVIRYKKDFLSHLTDAQRSLLLGLGLEGEAPPDPKLALGPAFDTLVSSVNCSSNNSKIRKRNNERSISFNQIENCMNNIYNNHHKHPIRMGNDNFDFNNYSFTPPTKNLCHLNEKKNEVLQEPSSSNFSENPFSVAQCHSMQYPEKFSIFSSSNDCEEKQSKELHLASNQQILFYEGQSSIVLDQIDLEYNQMNQSFNSDASNISSIVTGTPTSPLTSSNCYSVITSVVGNPVSNSNIN